ncbi:uncharacterized protein LOC112126367 [Cimex lectularius]|uniref:Nucleic-acid-binding protein from transposon X-element n=1 Tax=Cimex lectularius TaxID=79782 RepID=A0A8I6TIJ5_CIMLE|nr:uncharacterized protein LOC112126367 [Cimex lectularius]
MNPMKLGKVIFNSNFTHKDDIMNHKMGVIRGVEPDLPENEILNVTKSPVCVKSVRRISKIFSEENNQARKVTLGTCILTFDSQLLPESITIYGSRCKVDPYVPPLRQCRKCYRFNHFQDQCRSKQRCEICGLTHDEKSPCNNSMKYANCSGNHKASDKTCPEYVRLIS